MAIETPSSTEPRLSEVIAGIVADFQRLIHQQIDMVRAEVRYDWHKVKEATWPLAVGAALLAAGGLLLSFMLVYLIHWLTVPPGTEAAGLPLWGCFAVIGGAFVLVGGSLTYVGWQRFQSFTPFPEKSTEALKENIQWLTHHK